MTPRILVVPAGSDHLQPLLPSLRQREALQVRVASDFAAAIDSFDDEDPVHAVLAAGGSQVPGLLELMAATEKVSPGLPFSVALEHSAELDFPIDPGRWTLWHGPEAESSGVLESTLSLVHQPPAAARRRGADFLLAAMLCKRSVSITLDLAQAGEIYVEIVGGDAWNAYSDRNQGIGALEQTIYEEVGEAEIKALQTIPGERQILLRGLHVLGPIARRLVDEQSRTRREEMPNLATREVHLGTLAADLREIQEHAEEAEAQAKASSKTDRASAADPLDDLLAEGIEASLARDYRRAAGLFREVLQADPEHAQARFNLDRVSKHLRD